MKKIKKAKKSKKDQTYHFANTKNSIVKGILSQVSKNMNGFDSDDKKFLRKYFNNTCPYTGEKLTIGNIEYDHLIPSNIEYGGLTMIGNMIPTTKKNNKQKSGKLVEELNLAPEKLETINKYRSDFCYPTTYYNDVIRKKLEKLILDFEKLSEECLNEIIKEISKEKVLSKLNFDEKLEVKKVHSRLYKWKENNSIPHKTLLEFYKINNGENINYDSFEQMLKKKNISNLNNLLNINPKNYGKVFEKNDGNITIWNPVKQLLDKAYKP